MPLIKEEKTDFRKKNRWFPITEGLYQVQSTGNRLFGHRWVIFLTSVSMLSLKLAIVKRLCISSEEQINVEKGGSWGETLFSRSPSAVFIENRPVARISTITGFFWGLIYKMPLDNL
jgi:hypothetical protein